MYVLAGAALFVSVVVGVVRAILPGPRHGTAGGSHTVGNEFVLMDYGYNGDAITFLVIRNWPQTSSAPARTDDDRFNLMDRPPTVLAPDGSRRPIASSPHVYFFDGRTLTSFRVKMSEDDLDDIDASLPGMTDYRNLLPLIRRFQVPGN